MNNATTDASLVETWESYGTAWSAVPAEERSRLLDASVQDGITLASPQRVGEGRSLLESTIGEFQATFPGASFHTLAVRQHHHFLLVDWIAKDASGGNLLPGTTCVAFGTDGRIAHLIGFWAQSQ